MGWTDEQKALLWLSIAQVPARRADALIEKSGSAHQLWLDYAEKAQPFFSPGQKTCLSAYHSVDRLDAYLSELQKKNVSLLFRQDEDYPSLLREISDPPYLLYTAGDRKALSRQAVAIVGTRRASEYGRQTAYGLGRDIAAAGLAVVSGLAYGIDGAAHRGALKAGGVTIGILGSGINVPYPREHLQLMQEIATHGGLILSEYPLDEPPIGHHFPYRNRIISGLSTVLIFVEGRIRSGGMRTVDAALSQGREVYAVPGPVGKLGSEGPNHLLREGARILTCVQDLWEDMGLEPQTVKKPAEKENSILSLLREESLLAEEIAERLEKNLNEIQIELSILEIEGSVIRVDGNRYGLPG